MQSTLLQRSSVNDVQTLRLNASKGTHTSHTVRQEKKPLELLKAGERWRVNWELVHEGMRKSEVEVVRNGGRKRG